MKLVMKTLAVVGLCVGLVGCGGRPLRPQAPGKAQSNEDAVVIPTSKNVVNVVTAKDLSKANFALKVVTGKLEGDHLVDTKVVFSECAGETVAASANEEGAVAQKYSIVRQTSPFGVRNFYVVSEYVSESPINTMQVEVIAIDAACAADAPVVKRALIDVSLDSEKDAPTEAKSTFFNFGRALADI